jgi:ADP-heptose:LPS heptosyltransferase
MRILFVELLGGIGDVLIALPAIQAVARSHPNSQVTVLTFAPGGTLLESDPHISQVIYAPKDQACRSLKQLLETQSFDLIISDTNYDDIDKVIQASDAPHVVTNLWRSPPPDQFVSDRFLEILQAEGLIQADAIAPAKLYVSTQKSITRTTTRTIVLCPDAGMSIKRWSEQNFIRVGQALRSHYNLAVLVGSDWEQARAIAEPLEAELWQAATLPELAERLVQADLMIAADTGPARIAAALAVPTITLFGPSWHQRYGQPQPHVNLQGYPECPERRIENFTTQVCWYSGHCPIEGWATCVDAISVEHVLEAAYRALCCS